MRIQDLKERFDGICFIVGTGPSLRVFPKEILKNAPIIGLNQAWRHVDTTFNLTVHPELYLEFVAANPAGRPPRENGYSGPWIIKQKAPMAHLELTDHDHYVFHTSPDLKTVADRPDDVLFIGEGIQCTAADLAARMGAEVIVLVGCDGTNLGGDFHADAQHVRWLGQKPADQYALYRKRTAQVRKVLRDVHKVSVVTMTPFVSAGFPDEDYLRLCQELNLPRLPAPKDVSPYKRPTPRG